MCPMLRRHQHSPVPIFELCGNTIYKSMKFYMEEVMKEPKFKHTKNKASYCTVQQE